MLLPIACVRLLPESSVRIDLVCATPLPPPSVCVHGLLLLKEAAWQMLKAEKSISVGEIPNKHSTRCRKQHSRL